MVQFNFLFLFFVFKYFILIIIDFVFGESLGGAVSLRLFFTDAIKQTVKSKNIDLIVTVLTTSCIT